MQLIAQLILAIVSGYCFTAWLVFAYKAHRLEKSGQLTHALSEAIGTFTYRVGLVGTIAAAALYIGG